MKLSAVLLAAGRGRRMGRPKHLIEIDGEPMLARVVQALRESRAAEVVVVLQRRDSAGRSCAEELGARVACAEGEDQGRAASIRAGVRLAPEDHALLFALADQPWLRAADFDRLIAAAGRAGIVHASYRGERGSPVLFGARYREELLALSGKEGGRVLVARHPEDVAAVELDPERGRDVDRPADLR